MTNAPVSVSRGTGSEFRVGRVFDRTTSVYARNFLPFSLVALIASAPSLLVTINAGSNSAVPALATGAIASLLTVLATLVLGLLSQAILVYGAFQDLRSRPVKLSESIFVGLKRFFPILGLIIIAAIVIILFVAGMVLITMTVGFGLTGFSQYYSVVAGMWFIIAFILLISTVLALIVRWFISVPVCMVERFGPLQSLKRSSELTKGHRWRVLGIILLLYVASVIIGQVITVTATALGGRTEALIALLIWNTIWTGYFAILVVVTYYELRRTKEGLDIEQIAAVFD